MTSLIIFVGMGLLLLVVLIRLLREAAQARRGPEAPAELPIEELFPLHCRYFPQVRQTLCLADREYLSRRASPRIRRQARAERRDVTWQFLAGIREDYLRLDRLGRTVAALAPQVSRKLETERFWLGLRFRALYRVAQLRLTLGAVPLPQLERLTELVGSLAAQIQAATVALEQASVNSLP